MSSRLGCPASGRPVDENPTRITLLVSTSDASQSGWRAADSEIRENPRSSHLKPLVDGRLEIEPMGDLAPTTQIECPCDQQQSASHASHYYQWTSPIRAPDPELPAVGGDDTGPGVNNSPPATRKGRSALCCLNQMPPERF